MRIISWNCNGALRRKIDLVRCFQPDLLIVQEASERDVSSIDAPFTHWIGRKHRGLAVIGLRDASYRIDPIFDPDLPWFTPLHVDENRVLAVWASVLTSRLRYVRLLHHALDRFEGFLGSPRGMVVGDLNSSTVFDRKHGDVNHTSLVDRLSSMGYTSLWHHLRREGHGTESRPTFYLYRRPERTWHLDYAFVTPALMQGATLELGSPDEWLDHSDHLPLFLDLPGFHTARPWRKDVP